VAGEQRPRELPLRPHDVAAVPLEAEDVVLAAETLPFEKKPSEEILEGFDGERLSPARGGCGLRRG
jgi:hypothetical protein